MTRLRSARDHARSSSPPDSGKKSAVAIVLMTRMRFQRTGGAAVVRLDVISCLVTEGRVGGPLKGPHRTRGGLNFRQRRRELWQEHQHHIGGRVGLPPDTE